MDQETCACLVLIDELHSSAVISEDTASVLRAGGLSRSATLGDLGVDSLDQIDLMWHVEERLDINLCHLGVKKSADITVGELLSEMVAQSQPERLAREASK